MLGHVVATRLWLVRVSVVAEALAATHSTCPIPISCSRSCRSLSRAKCLDSHPPPTTSQPGPTTPTAAQPWYGLPHPHLRKVRQRRRHGCAEHERLPPVAHALDELQHLLLEAHLKHAVRLIHDAHLHALQAQAIDLRKVMDQTTCTGHRKRESQRNHVTATPSLSTAMPGLRQAGRQADRQTGSSYDLAASGHSEMPWPCKSVPHLPLALPPAPKHLCARQSTISLTAWPDLVWQR